MQFHASVQYEGADLADFYAKFRPKVPQQVTDRIICYLKENVKSNYNVDRKLEK